MKPFIHSSFLYGYMFQLLISYNCSCKRTNSPRREQYRRSYMLRRCRVDSLQPHGLQPARPLCSWDSPVKDTGVGCHFLLQGIFLIQGLNTRILHLLHWNVDSWPLIPKLLGWMTLFPDQQDWKNTGNLKGKGRSNAKKGKREPEDEKECKQVFWSYHHV